MTRREFFGQAVRISFSAVAALALPVVFPVFGAGLLSVMLYSQSLNKSIQGTRDGRILESFDSGKTWQTIARFGSHCAVIGLREEQNQIFAQLSVQGHTFLLASRSGHEWRTTDRVT